MTISWQIPRNCLAWVLLSQVTLIIPHTQRLPWWVMVAFVGCAFWRIMVYHGRWSLPPRLVKILFALLCFFGIYRNYGSLAGLEPTVALLFTGISLKLLEISRKRDVYILIFLAYFSAMTAFLFSQNFYLAIFILLTLLINTTALVALHQHSFDQLSKISLRKSVVIFLQAIPIMVVLFIIFPRIGPLWSVSTSSNKTKVGISDTMAPGDISQLSQSSELAFRAVFDSEKVNGKSFVMAEK